MTDEPYDPLGGDVLLTHTSDEVLALQNAMRYGAARERARIVGELRALADTDRMNGEPTTRARMASAFASRIEALGK